MSGGFLFVIGQPGAANYFLPLWRAWQARPPAWGWHILAAPGVATALSAEGIASGHITAKGFDAASIAALVGRQRAGAVVTSTSFRFVEGVALATAADQRIPSIQLIDSHYDYALRLRATNGATAGAPNLILLLDRISETEAIGEGLPAERLRVVGHPAWEHVPSAAPASGDRAAFVSQPIESDYGNRLGYSERSALSLVASAMERDDCPFSDLRLAVHPRETWRRADLPPGCTLAPSSEIAVAEAGTVFGMFSSLLVQTFLAGRRTIYVLPPGATVDLCGLGRYGYLPRVSAPAEVVAATAAPVAADKAAEVRSWYADSARRVEDVLVSVL